MRTWSAEAPSNLALIKYMGKSDVSQNQADNPSLSWTMNHLKTRVEIRPQKVPLDSWGPLVGSPEYSIKLSGKAELKFLDHFRFLKEKWGLTGFYKISSGNNFPSDCGLASSASSFAALTKASFEVAKETRPDVELSPSDLPYLSQAGSGSSCRSFVKDWCLWNGDSIGPVELPNKDLIHQVIVVSSGFKRVSSSQAHLKVKSSLLYEGRNHRARLRLDKLNTAFKNHDWEQAYQICWAEFMDMHMLFETAQPHFSYFTPDTWVVLNEVREYWRKISDGPIVTMDAGPNVHLLYKKNQKPMANQFRKKFESKFQVLGTDQAVGL